MKRILLDRYSKKRCDIHLLDTIVSVSNNGGKPREKKFRTNLDALSYSQKEMWKLLKKRYVFSDPNAEFLSPALHLYVGPGFTGYMPLAPIPNSNSFYLAYVLGEFDQENIYRVDEDGTIKLVVEMPPPSLTFDMRYSRETNKIYINANHNILRIDPNTAELSRLSSEKVQNLSVFSLSNSRIAWIDGVMLRVTDRAKERVVWQKKIEVEPHKIHACDVAAGLSHDGKYLAYYRSDNKRKITILDVDAASEFEIDKDSEAITRKLFFTADNKFLFIQEGEGAWQMKYYNLEKKEGWCRLEDSGEDTVQESSVDGEHKRLLVCTRGLVKAYDMYTKEELFRFKPENMINYCNAIFLQNYVAAYTDHGCVSLYKI